LAGLRLATRIHPNMAIECPYCGHRMSVRDAKSGRYQPKCGKCGQRFLLLVPDGGGTPTVKRIEAKSPAAAKTAPAVDATLEMTTAEAPAGAVVAGVSGAPAAEA